MKTTATCLALAAALSTLAAPPAALAFSPHPALGVRSAAPPTPTALPMFDGTGTSLPKEGDMSDDELKQMEQMAKSMGMSLQEYQLGMAARKQMEDTLSSGRYVGGDKGKGVTVERDGNTPSNHLVVTVTDEGKALGKEALEKEIVAALKDAGDQASEGRNVAQQDMMKYIAEEMKKMGMA